MPRTSFGLDIRPNIIAEVEKSFGHYSKNGKIAYKAISLFLCWAQITIPFCISIFTPSSNFHVYIYIYLEFVIYPSFFTMNIIWWEILFLQITIFYPFLKRIFMKRIKTFKFLFIFLLYMINIKNTWNMM